MNNVDLKQVWLNSLPSAINDAEDEWNNIVSKYSGTGRHYHTMEHLQNMYKELQEYYVDMLPVACLHNTPAAPYTYFASAPWYDSAVLYRSILTRCYSTHPLHR